MRSFERIEEQQTFTAILKAALWVTWHNGPNLAGAFTKLVGDADAIFKTRMAARSPRTSRPASQCILNRFSASSRRLARVSATVCDLRHR